MNARVCLIRSFFAFVGQPVFFFGGLVEQDYHDSSRDLPQRMNPHITGHPFVRTSSTERYVLSCVSFMHLSVFRFVLVL